MIHHPGRLRWIFTIGAIILSCRMLHADDPSDERKPNVIVFLTDDQGWGDTSCTGNQNIQTPNIDSLAENGVLLENFYVCPVCSPTRAEFLTGRYHKRSAVFSTSAGGERMNADERTVAEAFQMAGYATGAFGKWHNGMQYPYHPNARGFDEFYGFCSGHWGNYFDPLLEHNNQMVKGTGFIIDDFTDKAMSFIEKNKDEPFFVYLPYNTPHWPPAVPNNNWEKLQDNPIDQQRDKRFTKKKNQEDKNKTRSALALVDNVDYNVGRMIEKLDELGLTENTIILFFNDNGPNSNRWNDGLKGRKGSTDEGGVRSPLLVKWPAKIKGGKRLSGLTAAIDLLPTLCDMAEIDRVGDKPLDGMSFLPMLLDPAHKWPDRTIVHTWKKRYSLRSQQWRLDSNGQLFDIENDRQQVANVANEHPEVHANMQMELDNWKQELESEFGKTEFPRPFTVGHPDTLFTQVPARDGRESGTIKRSNRYPNCSYFLNWTSLDDEIRWPAEVLTSGKYRVHLFYCCKPANVGCTMELSFGDSKVAKKIEVAHDSPFLNQEFERFERAESFVKEFKQIDMGTIELNAGQGEFILKATDIPGDEAIEFRLFLFERIEGEN